jgi:hypothetical protein
VGFSLAQISCAFRHLVRKTQPNGGFMGEGKSPSIKINSLFFSILGSGIGTADIKA